MVDREVLVDALGDVQARSVTGSFWRQSAPQFPLDSIPPQGRGGRYDRQDGPGMLYASESERGAWAELFRHQSGVPEVSLHLLKRRIGRIDVVDLRVLDLTDQLVRERLGVVDDDLVGDDYAVCQALADAARAAGFEGVLAPAGGLPGHKTLVVLDTGLTAVSAGEGRVHRPPARVTRDLAEVPFRHARTFRSAVERLPFLWRLRVAWSLLRRHR